MTPAEFQAWFPDGEFSSLASSYVQGYITRATPMFNVATWGSFYAEGLANFVADRIVQSKARARRQAAALNPDNGATTEKHVGSVGTSYDSQLINKQASDTLMGTSYGRRYCELRDMVGLGGTTAYGDVEVFDVTP